MPRSEVQIATKITGLEKLDQAVEAIRRYQEEVDRTARVPAIEQIVTERHEEMRPGAAKRIQELEREAQPGRRLRQQEWQQYRQLMRERLHLLREVSRESRRLQQEELKETEAQLVVRLGTWGA